MTDSYDLKRFLDAQKVGFENIHDELRRGRKEGHWMWFVFPQLRGLGHSWMAQKFGISSRGEVEAYLAHPILGPRLIECTRIVNLVQDRSIEEIFGNVDSLKFRSSMTLFAHAAGDCSVFTEALNRYFRGQPDRLTLDRL